MAVVPAVQTRADRGAARAMGIRMRAGQVDRCSVVGHVEVGDLRFGAGGEQRSEQGGERGTRFSAASL